MKYVLCGSKCSRSDPDSNIIYGSNSKVTIASLTRLNLHPNTYIQMKKIYNSWHMFSCRKLFKLQIRSPSLILLITTIQDRWMFPSKSWEVRNSDNNNNNNNNNRRKPKKLKIHRLCNRITAHLERTDKILSGKFKGNWNDLKITQKIYK